MADTKIRELSVDSDTKARLENVAWKQRTTIADLTRTIAERANKGDFDKLPAPTGMPTTKGRIGVHMTDELWTEFGDTAWRLRTSRVKLVQAAVAHLYGDVPTDREGVVL